MEYKIGRDSEVSEGIERREVEKMSVSGCHNVFVYGSLLADEVVHVLLNRLPLQASATLHGFHRFKIKDRVYPAILPLHNNNVNGRVLLGISESELDILDEFEDVEYTRTSVQVSFNDNAEKLQVYTYVWSNHNDPNLYGEWDFEEWKQHHMDGFVKMTAGFMQVLELPESKPRVQTYESFYKQANDKPTEP